MQKLETISVALSDEVRRHEAAARDLFGAERGDLAADLGAQGAKIVANALQRGRRLKGSRIARADAIRVVATVSWPRSSQLWRGTAPLPDDGDLAEFWKGSRRLLGQLSPLRAPEWSDPDGLPRGMGEILAQSLLPPLLQGETIRLLRDSGASSKLIALLNRSGQLAETYASVIRSHLGKIENGHGRTPLLERLLKRRAEAEAALGPETFRKERERQIRAALGRRREMRRRVNKK